MHLREGPVVDDVTQLVKESGRGAAEDRQEKAKKIIDVRAPLRFLLCRFFLSFFFSEFD